MNNDGEHTGISTISLADARLQPPDGLVAYVERLLEEVKIGNVRGLAVVMAYNGRATSFGLSTGDASWADLYLATERLRAVMLQELNDSAQGEG